MVRTRVFLVRAADRKAVGRAHGEVFLEDPVQLAAASLTQDRIAGLREAGRAMSLEEAVAMAEA